MDTSRLTICSVNRYTMHVTPGAAHYFIPPALTSCKEIVVQSKALRIRQGTAYRRRIYAIVHHFRGLTLANGYEVIYIVWGLYTTAMRFNRSQFPRTEPHLDYRF
jgi:hypothetical protein